MRGGRRRAGAREHLARDLDVPLRQREPCGVVLVGERDVAGDRDEDVCEFLRVHFSERTQIIDPERAAREVNERLDDRSFGRVKSSNELVPAVHGSVNLVKGCCLRGSCSYPWSWSSRRKPE